MGGDSLILAGLVVWVPMVVVGTLSHAVPLPLPQWWGRLRTWEASGRCYELIGVRLFKRLLRRGPLALFNPGLHLPHEPDHESLARLDGKMRAAEASHLLLFVSGVAIAAHSAVRGWWSAALVTTCCNIVMNGYPILLQRYNRALLRRRFGDL